MAFWEKPELTWLIVLERLALTLPVSLRLTLVGFRWLGLVAHTALAFALASLEGAWLLLLDAELAGGTSVV